MDQPRIGTLNERSVHAALKEWYRQPGDRTEVGVDGYVIDLVRKESDSDALLIEVQTGNFSAIRDKLTTLTQTHHVHLIYPVAEQKWIVRRSPENGAQQSRRKSPKHGSVWQLFSELVRIPRLLLHPNFSVEVVLIQVEEVREYVGVKRAWRRRGWALAERRLLEIGQRWHFQSPEALAALLPAHLPDPFTTRDLAQTVGITRRLAQQTVYCLGIMDVIELVGKQGRAHLYQIRGKC